MEAGTAGSNQGDRLGAENNETSGSLNRHFHFRFGLGEARAANGHRPGPSNSSADQWAAGQVTTGLAAAGRS